MSQYNEVLNKKAVALRYDENKDAAPVIVASGLGYMAERIVEMANENGVPVYEDNSLARRSIPEKRLRRRRRNRQRKKN